MLMAAELWGVDRSLSLGVAWALALRLQKSEDTSSVDFKLPFLVLRRGLSETCFFVVGLKVVILLL